MPRNASPCSRFNRGVCIRSLVPEEVDPSRPLGLAAMCSLGSVVELRATQNSSSLGCYCVPPGPAPVEGIATVSRYRCEGLSYPSPFEHPSNHGWYFVISPGQKGANEAQSRVSLLVPMRWLVRRFGQGRNETRLCWPATRKVTVPDKIHSMS